MEGCKKFGDYGTGYCIGEDGVRESIGYTIEESKRFCETCNYHTGKNKLNEVEPS